MGKMVMALKKLGKKLTGKTINNDNTVGVINEIADEYEAPDLTPYATKVYVDGLMSGALKRLIVQALPEEDIDTNTIYMVLDSEASQQGNIYNEYLYINNAWELIGTTEVAETVIANPTLAGTEADLTGLQVGETKYKVPQGGGTSHLYQHFIVVNVYISADDVDYDLIFNYYSTNNTPLNSMSQVIDVLNSRRGITGDIGLSTGLYIGVLYGGNQEYHNCLFESISEQNDYINLYNQGEQTSLYLRLNDHTSTEYTIEDTVVEI